MKNKKIYKIIIAALVLSIIVINSCQKTKQEKWSSYYPMAIPYELRKEQFEKGNVAPNPSFEVGKIVKSGMEEILNLNGWQVIGNNVSWVKNEDEKTDEVSQGNYAIKIERKTDLFYVDYEKESEGIMSNYIPVLSGNYEFLFDIKLENIYNSKARIYNKIYDAIDIRVHFFDKDKNEISGDIINYSRFGVPFNHNFKSYAFSNYHYIKQFPWGRVMGRTGGYPTVDGDLPEGCRFVKLYLGLKGTGTMWVDNIEYKMSKWNFSALERMSPFFEKEYTLAELIIPTPKKILPQKKITYYSEKITVKELPIIVIPEKADKSTLFAANTLKNKLESVINKQNSVSEDIEILITNKPLGKDFDRRKIIFSIGKTQLFNQYGNESMLSEIKGEEQGYIIASAKTNSNVIFLTGLYPIGNYYAVTTAVQLLDKTNPVFEFAEVVDFPDFKGRSFPSERTSNCLVKKNEGTKFFIDPLKYIKDIVFYKLNKAYSSYSEFGKDWKNTPEPLKKKYEVIGKIQKETNVFSSASMVNPYFHLNIFSKVSDIPDSLMSYFTHSDEKSISALKNAFKVALDAGAKTIMYSADDFVPQNNNIVHNYSLWTQKDKEQFNDDIADAQAYVINRIYNWLEKEYPGTRLEFCPPYYNNEFFDNSFGQGEIYFHNLIKQIPKEVRIIWTGPVTRSLNIDDADVNRAHSYINRKPMVWDNTLYARNVVARYSSWGKYYPGKSEMCNLFEAYDINYPANINKIVDSHYYVNARTLIGVYFLKFATVADFTWNTKAYNPEFSLYKVLINEFGKKAAFKLLEFNDLYYKLHSVCLMKEMKQENKFNSNTKISSKAKKLKQELSFMLEEISINSTYDKYLLIEDLNKLTNELFERYDTIFKINN